MGVIKINNIIYGSNNSADIIYKNTTVEEKLNSIPVFDPSDNANIEANQYDYLTYGHIVNALNSSDINKALSANQGRVLSEKIDNIDLSYLEDGIASLGTSIDELDINKANNDDVNTLTERVDNLYINSGYGRIRFKWDDSTGYLRAAVDNTENVANFKGHVTVPFSFGVDANGNYGYIKDGADTVTPFNDIKTGEMWLRCCKNVTTHHNYTGGMTGCFYFNNLDFSDIDSFVFSYQIGTNTKNANPFTISNSSGYLVNVDPAGNISNQTVNVNNTTLPCTVQINVSYQGTNYLTIHSYKKHGVTYVL